MVVLETRVWTTVGWAQLSLSAHVLSRCMVRTAASARACSGVPPAVCSAHHSTLVCAALDSLNAPCLRLSQACPHSRTGAAGVQCVCISLPFQRQLLPSTMHQLFTGDVLSYVISFGTMRLAAVLFHCAMSLPSGALRPD